MDGIYEFEKIDFSKIDEREFNAGSNKIVYTTKPWINFIRKDSKAEPVIIRITKNGIFIGYFVSLLTVKFGIRILGSPFRGWSTSMMGIDTEYKEQKAAIYKELIPYVMKREKCCYMEIADRELSFENAETLGYQISKNDTLELDIAKDDAGLFKQMKTDCRNFIRQFERRGARLEFAKPDDEFAEQYYDQLEDVFAKQGLVPTYSLDKVKCLMKEMGETGNILCLRVMSPDNRCIATSIFPGMNEKFFFWGGASYRSDQHFRPNEYMIWTAIKYWRDRGCKTFDMVGVRDYKRKFGSYETEFPCIIISRPAFLVKLRNLAEKSFFLILKIRGVVNRKN